MSTVYKCDICGKEMEGIEGKAALQLNGIEIKFADSQAFTYSKENIKFDLCEDCYKDLVAYISSNKNIKMRNERKEPYNELRYTPK